jgi:hypothetical protein
MMRSVALIFSLLIISISAFSQGAPKSDSVFQKTQKPLRFMVFGDWGRNGEDRQKEVALEMGKVAKNSNPNSLYLLAIILSQRGSKYAGS